MAHEEERDDREGRRGTEDKHERSEARGAEEERQRNRFQRLGEQLTGLLDPEAAFRRGQGIVTGVTQATKEELMRIVSSEVRSFLDKMDAVDLLQQVIAGLAIDVHMQIRFSRAGSGPAQPEITRSETQIRTADTPRAKSRKRADPPDGEG